MAREKISISAKMGAVMGTQKGLANKLTINPQAKSWSQLPQELRNELMQEAKIQSRRIKRKTA